MDPLWYVVRVVLVALTTAVPPAHLSRVACQRTAARNNGIVDVLQPGPSLPIHVSEATLPGTEIGSFCLVPLNSSMYLSAHVQQTYPPPSGTDPSVPSVRVEILNLGNASLAIIVLQKYLDYETTNTEMFDIKVSNTQGYAVASRLTLLVQDENDMKPELEPVTKRLTVLETSPVGTFIYKFKAFDGDAFPPNNTIRFKLALQFAGFAIDSLTGILTTTTRFDFETDLTPLFVSVLAYDGHPSSIPGVLGPNKDILTEMVHIIDENDEEPTLPRQYEVLMSEAAPIGTPIVQVNATDPDTGSHLDYSLSMPESIDAFSIDPFSGQITLVKDLDFETIPRKYFLIVKVSDGVHTLLTEVVVGVTNVNDEPPEFTQSVYQPVAITENYTGIITVIKAFDTDPVNSPSTVNYYLDDDQPYLNHLTVHRDTGIVHLVEPLDLDHLSSSTLLVRITAREVASGLASSAVVMITVLDINDNPPYLYTPGPFYLVEAHEGFHQEIPLIIRDLDDASLGHGPPFGVEITHCDCGSAIFQAKTRQADLSLGTQSLIISTNSRFNQTMRPEYLITILMRDGTIPPMEGLQLLRVFVQARQATAVLRPTSYLSCDKFSCFNGGTCISKLSASFCECDHEHTGKHCEVWVTDLAHRPTSFALQVTTGLVVSGLLVLIPYLGYLLVRAARPRAGMSGTFEGVDLSKERGSLDNHEELKQRTSDDPATPPDALMTMLMEGKYQSFDDQTIDQAKTYVFSESEGSDGSLSRGELSVPDQVLSTERVFRIKQTNLREYSLTEGLPTPRLTELVGTGSDH